MRKWPTRAERVEIMLGLSRPNLFLLTFFCANFLFIAPETNAQKESRWVVTPNVNTLDDFNITPNSPALAKALTDASQYVIRWQLPADKQGWKARRPQVKAAFRKALGLERLPERTPLNARRIARHDMGDYILENVVFYSRPDFPVTANLYRPKKPVPGKLPAVVCPIGHALDTGKATLNIQRRCIMLARLGFISLVYDAIGHGERAVPGNIHHEAGFALLPLGQTVAGWMIWDSMRAVDYLLSLPEVDPQRIGITGNSGGGLNSLYTAAVDDRISCTAMAGYVFHFNNWIKYSGPHCTCCCLPRIYRAMEWFEIAGLIAPRALLMMQGESDDIFPISGARIAGRRTEAVYAMVGAQGAARFEEFAGYSHGYHQPFRESMYGWMNFHLRAKGAGEPVAETGVKPLAEDDPRLFCDRDGSIMKGARSVVELARETAVQAVENLPPLSSPGARERIEKLVAELTVPPDEEPHNLMPLVLDKSTHGKVILEKVFFLSEVGQHIPGLLWLPDESKSGPRRTVVIVDDRGKAAVAESGLVQPLVERGLAVLSVDLRGRGETLGKIGNERDNNYHLLWHSIMWGRPIAGRRAFDLIRTVDFIQRRQDLTTDSLTVVGIGDETLAVLLAAAADQRIRQVAVTEYFTSFVAQMCAQKVSSREELIKLWNSSAMQWGRLDAAQYRVDLGNVIPGILNTVDLPELVSLIGPRRLLYGRIRDGDTEGAFYRTKRFLKVLAEAIPDNPDWAVFYPDRRFDTSLLLNFMDVN